MVPVELILTIMFALIVATEVFHGLRRGFALQLVHTILNIFAAVIAFSLTQALIGSLVEGIGNGSIEELLVKFIGESEFAKYVPYLDFAEWLLVLPVTTIMAPMMISSIFGVLKFFTWIIYHIIRSAKGMETPYKEPALTIGGGLIAVIEGLLVVFITFLPIVSIFNAVDVSVDAVREKDDGTYAEYIEMYDSSTEGVREHFVIKAVNGFGGEKLLEDFATITIDDEETNLYDEIGGGVEIVFDLTKISDTDFTSLTENDKRVLTSVSDTIDESTYLVTFISSLLSDLGRAIEDGVFPVQLGEPYNAILNPAIHILATSNRDNLGADIDTILEAYFLLSDSGALTAYGTEGGEGDMKNSLAGEDENGLTVITRVTDILNANEHTRPLVTAITEMTIQMMANQLGTDYEVAEVYQDIKRGVNGVLAINPEEFDSPEEYEAARDEELNKVLTEQGIELEEEAISQIGDYMDANYGDIDELSDQEFNSIMLHYFETLGSGEMPK